MNERGAQPGDFMLDRYFRDDDTATRERARDAFAEFSRVLVELGEEVIGQQKSDSRESDSRGMIPAHNSHGA